MMRKRGYFYEYNKICAIATLFIRFFIFTFFPAKKVKKRRIHPSSQVIGYGGSQSTEEQMVEENYLNFEDVTGGERIFLTDTEKYSDEPNYGQQGRNEFGTVGEWFGAHRITPCLNQVPEEIIENHLAIFEDHFGKYGHLFCKWSTCKSHLPLDQTKLGSKYTSLSTSFFSGQKDPNIEKDVLITIANEFRTGKFKIDYTKNASILRKAKRVLDGMIRDPKDNTYTRLDDVLLAAILNLNGLELELEQGRVILTPSDLNRVFHDTSFDDASTQDLNIGESFSAKRQTCFDRLNNRIQEFADHSADLLKNLLSDLKGCEDVSKNLVTDEDLASLRELYARAEVVNHIRMGDFDSALPGHYEKPDLTKDELLVTSVNRGEGGVDNYALLCYKIALFGKILEDIKVSLSVEIDLNNIHDDTE